MGGAAKAVKKVATVIGKVVPGGKQINKTIFPSKKKPGYKD